MEGFFSSLDPLLKKYKIEVFLIFASLVIAVVSIIIFAVNNQSAAKNEIILSSGITDSKSSTKLVVDIAGAVQRPDVYEVSFGARLKDILILAGGLSADADRVFFARNFNLARLLADQEKIYIPTRQELENGQVISTVSTGQSVLSTADKTNSQKISLNSASIDELDTLPGIGKVTAQKIIQNRPYQSVDDLLTKKLVGKSVFEKIKELISL